jgi:hypothetical protein
MFPFSYQLLLVASLFTFNGLDLECHNQFPQLVVTGDFLPGQVCLLRRIIGSQCFLTEYSGELYAKTKYHGAVLKLIITLEGISALTQKRLAGRFTGVSPLKFYK